MLVAMIASLTPSRVAILLASVVTVIGLVAAVVVGRSWQEDYGTWNPLVVRDVVAYGPITWNLISPYRTSEPDLPAGLSGPEELAWRTRHVKLDSATHGLRADEQLLARWDTMVPPERFRPHHVGLKQEIELKIAWERSVKAVLERHDTFVTSTNAAGAAQITMLCYTDAEHLQVSEAYQALMNKILENAQLYSTIVGSGDLTGAQRAASAAGRPNPMPCPAA